MMSHATLFFVPSMGEKKTRQIKQAAGAETAAAAAAASAATTLRSTQKTGLMPCCLSVCY